MICPKCGYQNVEGTECPRCGVILSRYHQTGVPVKPGIRPGINAPPLKVGRIRMFFRILRWVILAGSILAIFLMFLSHTPPDITATQEAASSAKAKIAAFQSSIGSEHNARLSMDEAELNSWLGENLALRQVPDSTATRQTDNDFPIDLGQNTAGEQTTDEEAIERLQSTVRDVKIKLLEDSLRIYASFDFHGMDLSLELEGRPEVRNGYLRLDPTSGRLGSLPLPAGTLKSATTRLFDSPNNKEKFKLPQDIRDIRIENGQLVVISRQRMQSE